MNLLQKEPVFLGAALTVTADAVALLAGASDTTQTVLHGVTVAWVAWVVRTLSTPTVKADAAVDAATEHGRNAAIADIALLKKPAAKKAG